MAETTQLVFEGNQLTLVTTIVEKRKVALNETLLRVNQKPSTTIIPNVFKVATNPTTLISHSTGSEVYVTRLAFVPFKMVYRDTPKADPILGDIYEPVFLPNGWQTTGLVGEKVQDLKLFGNSSSFTAWFATTYVPGQPVPSNCYLYLCHLRELFIPPLPNIFDDGRICMGEQWMNNKTGGYIDKASQILNALQSFSTSLWNSHLAFESKKLFCCINKDKYFVHDLQPGRFVKTLDIAGPAFLGSWTPFS